MSAFDTRLIAILIVSGYFVSASEILENLIKRSPTLYVRRVYQTAMDEAVALSCSFKNTKESLGYYSNHGDSQFNGRPILWFKVDRHGGKELIAIGNALESKMAAFHNYKVLSPDAATSILYIGRVAANHIGFYKCALEDGGLIHQMFYLNVTVSKLVIRHPFSHIRNVIQGSSVRLSCNVSYTYPRPLIYWTRGRAKNRGNNYPVGWGPVLNIRNMGREHADIYTCHADDFLTTPVSTSFRLHLDGSKPKGVPTRIMAQYNHIPAGFRRTDPRYGHLYILTCRSSGNPRVSFKWFKDGSMVTDGMYHNLLVHTSTGINGQVVSELQILRFKLSDRGVYVCRAFNRYGSKDFSFRLDKIQDLPKYLLSKQGLFKKIHASVDKQQPIPTDDEDFKPRITQNLGSGSGQSPTTTTTRPALNDREYVSSGQMESFEDKGSGNIIKPAKKIKTTINPTTVIQVSNFTTKP